MNYEILVNTGGETWERMDLADDFPSMVFQVNDLNQLATRNSSYSQALSLPITERNCDLFGFSDVFEARSEIPYIIRRCMIYVDGLVIGGNSLRLELRGVSDVFECQVVSNIIDLFDSIESKTMENLPGFSEPFLWTIPDVSATSPKATGRKYLAAASCELARPTSSGEIYGMPSYRDDNQRAVAMLASLYPYYPLRETVELIFKDEGYTLETDVQLIEGDDKSYLSFPKLTPGSDSFALLNTRRVCSFTFPSTSGDFPFALIQSDLGGTNHYGEWAFKSFPDLTETVETVYAMEYTSVGAIKLRFKITTKNSAIPETIGALVWYRVSKRGNYYTPSDGGSWVDDVESESDSEGTDFGGQPWESEEIELSPGERVYIEAYLMPGSTIGDYQTTIDVVIPTDGNQVCPGGKIYPGKSTDFATRLDLVKLFVQLYGLLVDVDEDRKVVRAYTMDYLYRRADKSDYADWSGKIDMSSERSTSFRNGSYAQRSRFLFANNGLLDFQDVGLLPVGNSNLAISKDVLTLGAESAPTIVMAIPALLSPASSSPMEVSARLVSDGERVDYVDDIGGGISSSRTIPLTKPSTAKTHVVFCDSKSNYFARMTYVPQRGSAGVGFRHAEPVGAGRVAGRHYQGLYRIMNPARVVEASFNLSPEDVSNLDLLRPVYIEAYGDFFYIQKIENYIPNKLTKCTLACLNIANN